MIKNAQGLVKLTNRLQHLQVMGPFFTFYLNYVHCNI